ncbi:hypothetical protein M0802_000268 [Mischocyttarus mexicanus]|nr:hypothetical protein M0802_000268 [Mischocyttarus mexicanus]
MSDVRMDKNQGRLFNKNYFHSAETFTPCYPTYGIPMHRKITVLMRKSVTIAQYPLIPSVQFSRNKLGKACSLTIKPLHNKTKVTSSEKGAFQRRRSVGVGVGVGVGVTVAAAAQPPPPLPSPAPTTPPPPPPLAPSPPLPPPVALLIPLRHHPASQTTSSASGRVFRDVQSAAGVQRTTSSTKRFILRTVKRVVVGIDREGRTRKSEGASFVHDERTEETGKNQTPVTMNCENWPLT